MAVGISFVVAISFIVLVAALCYFFWRHHILRQRQQEVAKEQEDLAATIIQRRWVATHGTARPGTATKRSGYKRALSKLKLSHAGDRALSFGKALYRNFAAGLVLGSDHESQETVLTHVDSAPKVVSIGGFVTYSVDEIHFAYASDLQGGATSPGRPVPHVWSAGLPSGGVRTPECALLLDEYLVGVTQNRSAASLGGAFTFVFSSGRTHRIDSLYDGRDGAAVTVTAGPGEHIVRLGFSYPLAAGPLLTGAEVAPIPRESETARHEMRLYSVQLPPDSAPGPTVDVAIDGNCVSVAVPVDYVAGQALQFHASSKKQLSRADPYRNSYTRSISLLQTSTFGTCSGTTNR